MNERRVDLITSEQYNIFNLVFWRWNIRDIFGNKELRMEQFSSGEDKFHTVENYGKN